MDPMKPQSTSGFHPCSSGGVAMFPAGSWQDPEVMEVSASSWAHSSQRKRKRNKNIVGGAINVLDEDDGPSGVVIIGEKSAEKKEQLIISQLGPKTQINPSVNFVGPSTFPSLVHHMPSDFPGDLLEDFYLGDWVFGNPKHEVYQYQTHGNIIEASGVVSAFDAMDLPSGVEMNIPGAQKMEPVKPNPHSAIYAEAERKLQHFKQFDTVKDYSDHHFVKQSLIGINFAKKPPKDWTKRIQHEWKVLEKDLPDTIFVRVYEERMDLLRAVIIGPAGTPYHDGLFFFDVCFPANYPSGPPLVYYHSGGLRLNPNLYDNGKVCLSLLGTWSGQGCERWSSKKSTMLQVLVSIQALVLNAKPYFNEPGFANSAGTPQGEKYAFDYNENTFLLSCKTMLYSLRRPPKNFEDFVNSHFHKRGKSILVACKAYMNGAQVGCVDKDGVQDVDEGDKSCSQNFRSSLKILFEELIQEFTVKGVDCSSFLSQPIENRQRTFPNTALTL